MDYICGPEWDKRIITINPKQNVGIMMSGGVDSFVLYNLFDEPKPKIFHVELLSGADDINVVKKLTNREDITVVKDFPWVKDSKLSRFEKIIKSTIKTYKIDELYLAANRVPPVDCFPEFISKRKPERPWLPNHPVIKLPFLTLYKYNIIDLANRLGIDISETQSCLEWKTGHCGKCWQCREKKWAYQQLELKG